MVNFSWEKPIDKKTIQNNTKQSTSSVDDVLLVLWFLWSGKTTLISKIATYLQETEQDKIAIIVNDIGKINIDNNRLQDFNTVELTNGCICCKDLDTLKQTLSTLKEKNYKHIIIEPTGIASGEDITQIVKEMGLWIDVISLINTTNFTSPKMDQYTLQTQANLADVIWLTHINNFDAYENVHQDLTLSYPDKPLIPVIYESNEKILKDDTWNSSHVVEKLLSALEKKKTKDQNIVSHKYDNVKHDTNKYRARSILLSPHVTADTIKNMIDEFTDIVVRAKGTLLTQDGYIDFDYVDGGNISYNIWTSINTFINFITTRPLQKEEVAKIENYCAQDYTNTQSSLAYNTNPMKLILTQQESDQAVQKLLDQYNEYMSMYQEKQSLEQKNLETFDQWTTNQIIVLEQKLQILGDAMKFHNPYIRLMYKKEAYKNDANKKVETVWDLLLHCANKTDICYKRLHFLNTMLKENFDMDLTDNNSVSWDKTIANLLVEDQNNPVIQLIWENDFMKKWSEYEYYTIQQKVAKWQNYPIN